MILKLKTNITTQLSVVNYPYIDLFQGHPRSNGRNRGSQENPYNSLTEQARDLCLVQIEREQFFLSDGHIKIKNPMENSFPISFSKCAARIHLIGQLSDQSNFTCFYSPKCPLSNGENRSSLSCSVRQLFKKHQSLLYFENDIS